MKLINQLNDNLTKKIGPNPIDDIKACVSNYKAKTGNIPVVMMNEATVNLLLEKSGCKTVGELMTEYNKRYPMEPKFKLKIINK